MLLLCFIMIIIMNMVGFKIMMIIIVIILEGVDLTKQVHPLASLAPTFHLPSLYTTNHFSLTHADGILLLLLLVIILIIILVLLIIIIIILIIILIKLAPLQHKPRYQ